MFTCACVAVTMHILDVSHILSTSIAKPLLKAGFIEHAHLTYAQNKVCVPSLAEVWQHSALNTAM